MIRPEPTPAESSSHTRAARSLAIANRYRRTQVFGLLLIAAAILAVALYRADPHVLFPPGWWR